MPHKNEFLELRLQHLADNIRKDLDLIKEYEDVRRLEADPLLREKSRRAIQQLRESAERYQQEYDELRAEVTGEPSVVMKGIDAQLRQLNAKLDALRVVQEVILDEVTDLRQAVLSRFDASEQVIINAVVERLDENQLVIVQAVLDGMDARRFPDNELQETLAAMQDVLSEIRQKGVTSSDPALASGVERMEEVVKEPTLDVSHKLKLSVPIIPFILSYQGVVELKSGLNLKAAWQRLVAKMRGNR